MKKLIILLAFLLIAPSAWAAGSSTTINDPVPVGPWLSGQERPAKVVIEWTADDSTGSVPDASFSSDQAAQLKGKKCFMAVTDPGSPAPTADYDIAIEDEYGVDVFGDELGDRHTSDSEQAIPLLTGTAHYGGRVCAGVWTFKLTNNSVNSATGTCVLYFE